MTADEFIKILEWDIKISKDAFIENLKDKFDDTTTFCDWFEIWVAWGELSSKEDCENYFYDGRNYNI